MTIKIKHLIVLTIIACFGIGFQTLGAKLSQQEINDLVARQNALPHESSHSDDLLFFGGIVFLLTMASIFVFNWFVKALSGETKNRVLRFVFILSPVCLSILIARIFFISAETNPIIDSVAFASFLVFTASYFLWGIFPATSAYASIQIIKEMLDTYKAGSGTFWSLLDKINSRRFWFFSFLGLCLAILIFLNASLILELSKKYSLSGNMPVALGMFFVFALAIFYAVMEFLRYGHVNIPASEHKKFIDIKRSVENISIAAGIKKPEFAIIAHNNPNAFSICPNFKKPVIYLTSGLLNLMEKNELEAIIAHEIAFISSGRIFDYRRLNNILSLLKTLSFLSFIFLLAALDPFLIIMGIGVVLYLSIGFANSHNDKGVRAANLFNAAIVLVNPPYLFVNFISYLVYYRLSFDEEFYADLKAVQFTRYPKALYSALEKLSKYKSLNTERLPEEFYYLYFVGENAVFWETPMPQPSISERKALLAEIDETLQGLTVKEETFIKCPNCGRNMEEMEGMGHYGLSLKIEHCSKCKIVWFDNWELWYMADLAAFEKDKEFFQDAPAVIKKICPHCGVELEETIDQNIPPGVKIWTCPACNGNLLDNRSLGDYLQYKKQLVASARD